MRLTGQLLDCSRTGLIRLAAIVWLIGVVVLLVKSSGMLVEALSIGTPVSLAILTVCIGLAAGVIKAKYLFIRICKTNIKRIVSLQSPKIWQFYRTRFFFFLGLMILFGSWAYGLAQDNPVLLLCLAALELSISTALCISSKCFCNIRIT